MTKCWYLLNLGGGCIREYYVVFSTFILYTLRYFKIKHFNLTIPLTVVWQGTVYGDIFPLSKTKIKPFLLHSCHTLIMLASLTDPQGQKNHPQIKKQIADLSIKVGWSLWTPGRDLQPKWTGPSVEWGNTGLAPQGLQQKLGIQSEDWWELAKRRKMSTWHPPLSMLPGTYSLRRERFWFISTHALLGTKYLTLLFWLQLPLVQM